MDETELTAASLLLEDFDYIFLLHLKRCWTVGVVDAAAIEQKSQRVQWDRNSVSVGFLQFRKLSGLFHSEVKFVGVLTHHLSERNKRISKVKLQRLLEPPFTLILIYSSFFSWVAIAAEDIGALNPRRKARTKSKES